MLKGRNGEGRGAGEASGRGYQDTYIGECGLVKRQARAGAYFCA